jgi:hypothetical protein
MDRRPDPKVAKRLRLAGRVVANDGTILKLADHGDGPGELPLASVFLEPTRANFNAVVQALMQGRAERVLKEVQEVEGELRAGKASLDAIQRVLAFFGRADLQIADGVPLRFEKLLDQAGGPTFPPAEVFQKPTFSFDPGGSRNDTWTQRQLDVTGPYDRATFEQKRPKIAAVCEARRRGDVAETVAHFLEGLPDIRSHKGLISHGTGLVGRFRLQKPQVEFFETRDDSASAYAEAARSALSAAAARDQPWDLALVQVQRSWKDRPADDSPYWSAKATFLRRDVPVQALSTEMMGMGDFEYACALANASLAAYAKLGGTPWLLKTRPSTDHELVFGLGSHTRKEGRRGAGERVVGITTVFSSQGNYLLDARTAAVPFDRYPAELRDTLVAAVERVRREEAWRAGDTVRLVFHAFIQLRQETADAVIAAVAGMGLSGVKFAFLHVAEDHPFTLFDRAAPTGKGAYAPERGQAVELSDHEWLLALTGRDRIKAAFQGPGHPRSRAAPPAREVDLPRHEDLNPTGVRLRLPLLAHLRPSATPDHAPLRRRDCEAARWPGAHAGVGPRHRRGRRGHVQALVLVTAGPTIPQIRAGLLAAAEPTLSTAVHAQAFRAWLLNEHERLSGLSEAAAANFGVGGGRSAGHVAALGYADAAGLLTDQFRPALAEGLTWLGERAWFRPHQPPTLEADGVAALGVALGVHRRGAPPKAGWLQDLVVRSARSPDLPVVDRSLFIAAAHLIDAPGRQDAAAMLPEARLVLVGLGLGATDDACCSEAWQRVLRFAASEEVVPEAALLLRALDVLTERNLPARLGRLGPRDVLHVLQGMQRSFKRWSWELAPRTPRSAVARWEVENEYHVQNLLWAVLAPLFPDLNDEETLPPVGQKNPRVDLSIPSLGTVVEVKFMRTGTSFQNVIEEIAADASLYATDPRWTSLIPFVWDDTRRIEEHQKLAAGLKQLSMVVGAVVVSRPGKMDRP